MRMLVSHNTKTITLAASIARTLEEDGVDSIELSCIGAASIAVAMKACASTTKINGVGVWVTPLWDKTVLPDGKEVTSMVFFVVSGGKSD